MDQIEERAAESAEIVGEYNYSTVLRLDEESKADESNDQNDGSPNSQPTNDQNDGPPNSQPANDQNDGSPNSQPANDQNDGPPNSQPANDPNDGRPNDALSNRAVRNREEGVNYLIPQFPSSLKNSCPTRWNTILKMLRSIANNYQAINVALSYLRQFGLQILLEEVELMNEIIPHLKFIESISNECGISSRSVTALAVLHVYDLEDFLSTSNDNQYLRQVTKDFRRKVRENLSRRYLLLDDHLVAFLLDPIYKNSNLIADRVPDRQRFLVNKLNELGDAQAFPDNSPSSELPSDSSPAASSPAAASTSATPPSCRLARLNALEQRRSVAISTPPVSSHLEVVFANYLQLSLETDDEGRVIVVEPEQFWQSKGNDFKELKRLFKKTACIQLSQQTSERTFSKTNLIATRLRANLANEKLMMLIYIKENYKFMQMMIKDYDDGKFDEM